MDSYVRELALAFIAGGAAVAGGARLLRQARRPNAGSKGASTQIAPPKNLRSTTPHPNWKPGDPQPPPFPAEYRSVDPAVTPASELYPLIISSIVPRPIGFISTTSADGTVTNLAPFSYFGAMGHDPPTVAIGFAAARHRSHGRKDTLVNLLETRELVVNIISEWYVEAANHCCGNFDYGENEFELSGLHPLPSDKVKPPRVQESAVQMECKVKHTYDLENKEGKVTGTIVIAEIVLMHIAEGVAGQSPSGKLIVDIEKYRPVSRLGGSTYGRVREIFDLPRPDRGPAKQPLKYTSNPE